ncbi:MAG: WD40 repeat domain-containing protein, partial [bacterium]
MDGSGYIARGSWDNKVKVWDSSCTLKKTLTGHTQSVTSLAVTSNRLASGSDDTTIRIWN